MKKLCKGWHQLLGDPGCGKTVLVSLWAKQFKRCVWVTSFQDHSPAIWEAMNWVPLHGFFADDLAVAFEALESYQSQVDVAVLDSLAGFGGSRTAWVVKEHWFEAKVPIVVVNQLRHPVPPGGKIHALARTYRLDLFRQKPALYSHLRNTDEWLVWWKEKGPELRSLDDEDKLWV